MPKLSISMSREVADVVAAYSDEMDVSQSRWINSALVLYAVCHKAKREGKQVCVVSEGGKIHAEIVGLL